ncbi:MAG: hypothetical protein K0Q64_2404, partial [Nitrobacter vulgaris]|nr:hypothetical protein [Nitrobacter vulgaris]
PLMVEVISDDTDVARVSMDESGNAVIVSPRLEGTALITVRVSDGNFVVDEQFDFSSLVVETTRYVAFETPNAASIVLTNVADFDVSFQFDINDHMYPGDRAGSLLRMVEEESLTAEASTPFRIWKALAENIRRGATLTESTWIHGPVRLLSSLGFGYCDDVASAFSILAKEAGYEVRVWTLSGHVVAEVWVDGRPPGATMTIGGFWSHPLLDAPTGNVIPFAARARLDLPAGWTGKLPTAFVIVSVEGMGQLQLNDVFFEIGSAELQARLANFDIPQLAPTITRSDAPIAVTVLVNANSGAFKELNRVFLGGLNVGAISVSPVPNPSATNLK